MATTGRGYLRTLLLRAKLDNMLVQRLPIGVGVLQLPPRGAEEGEGKVTDIPLRNPGGSRWMLSRVWAGLLLIIIFFAWCKPAGAQDSRKVKVSVQPTYPELAKKNKIQGATRLQVVIAPDGTIKDIKVLGGNPVLVQASVEAVKKWKYEPAPGETTSVLKFEFRPDQ
jgi:TonB family protein